MHFSSDMILQSAVAYSFRVCSFFLRSLAADASRIRGYGFGFKPKIQGRIADT